MSFQTDTTLKVPPPVIVIKYCDDSEEVKTYLDTGYSRLLAKEEYQELIQHGMDTSVVNQSPHIVSVAYSEGPVQSTEQFICRCRKEALSDRTA